MLCLRIEDEILLALYCSSGEPVSDPNHGPNNQEDYNSSCKDSQYIARQDAGAMSQGIEK